MDQTALAQDMVVMVVQVNGKLRAHIDVPVNASEAACTEIAFANSHVQKFVPDPGLVRRKVHVPNKLLNLVV